MSNNETPEDELSQEELEELEELENGPHTRIEEKFKTIGLFGEINEEIAGEVVFGIHALAMDTDCEKPIEIMISTPGGNASDMFAIYDVIRLHRQEQIIETFAIGKVMSAGVLILASGTKGSRKIGKNCRIMIHQCSAGNMGPVSVLKNEMKEIMILQQLYLEGLVAETDLTLSQIKRMISKNQNVYFSAEEAVKYGIADIIV
jgi:ATP-dependent Clp protease protease subunit